MRLRTHVRAVRGALAVMTAVTLALLPATAAAQSPPQRQLDHACPDDLPDAGFDDTGGNEHAVAIDCLAFYRITAGTSATTYSPGGTVRRDQLATFMVRLLTVAGISLPDETDGRFSDVPATNPHSEAVRQLAALGIVGGHPDGTYRPAEAVRRDQMTAFLNRTFAEISGAPLQPDRATFPDTDGNIHQADIEALAAAGVVAGFADGTFRPARAVRRDQMAAFVMRLVDVLVERDSLFTSVFAVTLDGYLVVDDDDPAGPRFGQGDPAAVGHAYLRLHAGTGRLCYEIALVSDSPFVDAAVRRGPMEANGPVAVELLPPDDDTGTVESCEFLDPELLRSIEADPGAFSISVRTEAFPSGAARGQVGAGHRAVALSGAFVVDDAGDGFRFGHGQLGATGVAVLQIDSRGGHMCSFVTTDADGPFEPVRVHRAAMPENGPPVIELAPPDPTTGEASHCVDAEPNLLDELRRSSERFAVVVASEHHPQGAVRSQVDSGTLGIPLSGEAVVDDSGEPGHGEADATGTAWLQAHFASGFTCYWLTTDASGPFVSAGIYRGDRTDTGQSVASLDPPDDVTGEVSACAHIDPGLLADTADVEGFFVLIATEDHPDGAVRGQFRDGLLF